MELLPYIVRTHVFRVLQGQQEEQCCQLAESSAAYFQICRRKCEHPGRSAAEFFQHKLISTLLSKVFFLATSSDVSYVTNINLNG